MAHHDAGKGGLYDRLKAFLPGELGQTRYKEVGAELEMSESAVKVAIHRLRRRYRALVRDEVAQTVAEGEDVDAELSQLFSALSA